MIIKGTPGNATQLCRDLKDIAQSSELSEEEKIKKMERAQNDFIRNRLQIAYLFIASESLDPILSPLTKILTLSEHK